MASCDHSYAMIIYVDALLLSLLNSWNWTLRKLHHTQHILANDAPNLILSNDMPDNEDEEVEPAKQRHLK